MPAALYGVLVFPFLWALSEQMRYDGYLLPGDRTAARGQHGVQHEEVALLQVVSRSAAVAVAIGAFVWSLEHALIPLTFDPKFMTYRILAPLPFSTWQARLYLRLRQLVPSPARTP